MKKVVIYSRVSTEEQDFRSQVDELQKYADYSGFGVVEIFSEKVSGYKEDVERAAYDQMKEFVISNSIELILCWELSRFGRNSLHTLNEIDYFQRKGINIYFKKENIYTLSNDPVSKMVLNLLASIAEMERNTIVARTKRGAAQAARLGKRINFPIMPYGFNDENGYIVINEQEANVVRMIYEMVSKGSSLRAVVNHLNSLDIPTRKSQLGKTKKLRNGNNVKILWRTNTIRKILKSTLYKGERNYKGDVKISIPQICSTELWNKVQDVFSNHIGNVNTTKYNYLFKGKLYCGKCGYIIGTRTEIRYPSKPSYYFCTARRDKSVKCDNGQFNSKLFDEIIYEQLFRSRDILVNYFEESKKEFDKVDKEIQINFYTNEIEKLEAERKRTNNLYKKGLITEDEMLADHSSINSKNIEYENQIKKIEKEIKIYNEFDVGKVLGQLQKETNFDIKREFVLKYVDKILVHKVTDWNIDFSKFNLLNPNGSDKMIFLEVYAFGSSVPLRMTLTNVTKQCFINKGLKLVDGKLSLLKIQ